MRLVQKLTVGVASLLAPVILSVPATAATIIGGGTSVKLTAAPTLTGLGLSFATFGSASANADAMGIPTATFLITGGSINDATGAARIEHNGSGLNFTGGGKALSIGDFLINTSTNILTLSGGKQIDTTTGLEYLDPKSIISLANGAYLDTKNNILTTSDGKKIDTISGLEITT